MGLSQQASLPTVGKYTQSDANSEQVTHRIATPTTIPAHTSTPTNNEPTAQPTQPPQVTPTSADNSQSGSTNYGYGTPPSPTGLEQQLEQRVLTLLNRQRVRYGLAPLVLNAGLSQVARMHTWAMTACGESHTCQGEPSPCERIFSVNHQWNTCGESLGQNALDRNQPWQSTQSLLQSRLDELTPAHAHESDYLNPHLHSIGISIIISRNHSLWLTEDFAG
ncbi:hypothetical protein KSX_82860 [Ktedonospora formicarum]|uniref:SCP domain-containing protein n=1 Tax=Ktedonospora formicarum TaxID=2778364 RepID=A0A8J3IA88_9CHLR|nr:hypothetical protein KSX_82860 [Ktedonospora formicarum]